MLRVNPLILPSGGSPDDFYAGGVFWRGGTYYQFGTLPGSTDTKVGTLSVWIRRFTWNNSEYIHEYIGSWSPCWFETDDTFRFVANDTSGGLYSVYIGTAALPRDQLWHHYALSFDSAAGVSHLYVDGVNKKVVYGTQTNTVADWTRSNLLIGRRYDVDVGYFYGGMAEYYFNTQEYIDLSVPANLQKFRNAAGKPVNLGPDGSWPTGKKPQVYLRHTEIANGATASDFRTNRVNGAVVSSNGGGNYEDPLVPSSFGRQVFGVVPSDYAGSWSDYTLRMQIAGPGIFNKPLGQTQARVSVAASTISSGITIDKLYIGHYSGPDPWDAGDLTQLFFSGAPGVTLVPPQSRWSDWGNWVYNGGPIILTAHFVTGGGTPPIGYNTNAQCYSLLANDAGTLNTSGYSATGAAYVYLFCGIEMV